MTVIRTIALSICFLAIINSAAISRDLDDNEREIIKLSITSRLKDPNSAQIRFLDFSRTDIYCGFINAKNSYGGYVGFVPFFAAISVDENYRIKSVTNSMLGDTPTNEMAVESMCFSGGYRVRR